MTVCFPKLFEFNINYTLSKMCNSVDDEGATSTIPVKQIFSNVNASKCNKCKENIPNVVLRNKDAYCRHCFLIATAHKFKGLLGKHRILQPNENVLIIHNCGHPTTALLHLIRTGLDLTSTKRLRLIPFVLCIENYKEFPNRRQLLKDIEDECKFFNFPIYFVSFSEYIAKPKDMSNLIKTSSKDVIIDAKLDDEINNIFETRKISLSNKDEVFDILRRRLILDISKLLKCTTVFTTEIAVDVGIQMLTNIALGRGSHLPLDAGICDNRDPSVKIIRPLRFIEMKELAFYNIFHNLEPVCLPFTEQSTNPYSSVKNLMKTFVQNLQQNFPATIMTIVRTGDKLALNESIAGNNCKFCKAPIEAQNNDLSSSESTDFSEYVSTLQKNQNINMSTQDQFINLVDNFNANVAIKDDYCNSCSKIMGTIVNKNVFKIDN